MPARILATLMACFALLVTAAHAADPWAQSAGYELSMYEELAEYARLDPATRAQFLDVWEEKRKALAAFDTEHAAELDEVRGVMDAAEAATAAEAMAEAEPAEGTEAIVPTGEETEFQAEAEPEVDPAALNDARRKYHALLMARYKIARQHDAEAFKLVPRRALDSFRSVLLWRSISEHFEPAHLNKDQVDQAKLVCERVLSVSATRGSKSPAEQAYIEIRNKILTKNQRLRMEGLLNDNAKAAPPPPPVTKGETEKRELGFKGSTRSEGGGLGSK